MKHYGIENEGELALEKCPAGRPVWTLADEGRIIYDELDSTAYFGGASGWEKGLSGWSGISGYSGIGLSGYSGISGVSGYSSISGYSGISGVSGYSAQPGGASGFSGISGVSGYSGISGVSGYSGISGKSGYSGYSGYSSTSGYSGAAASAFIYANSYVSATSWVVDHNLNAANVLVQCWRADATPVVIEPVSITYNSANRVTVSFSPASVAGSVVVLKAN